MQHLLHCLPSKQSYSWRSLVSHSIYGVWQFLLKAIYPRSLFVTLTHTWVHPKLWEAFLLSIQSSTVNSLPKFARLPAISACWRVMKSIEWGTAVFYYGRALKLEAHCRNIVKCNYVNNTASQVRYASSTSISFKEEIYICCIAFTMDRLLFMLAL